jgi:hypothetical protein
MKKPKPKTPRNLRRAESQGIRREEQKLAAQFNVSDRTVRNWKAAGAPLDSPEAMPRWIMDHQLREGNPDALPDGVEHVNLLRHMVEAAAGHYLHYAFSASFASMVESQTSKGRTLKEAQQDGP